MLGRVVDAAQAVAGVEKLMLLGPERHGLPDSMPLLADPGAGFNSALAGARDAAAAAGVDRLLFLSADLPSALPAENAALVDLPDDAIAIAPDRAGTGTNASSHPLPQARLFRFTYGENSSQDTARKQGGWDYPWE